MFNIAFERPHYGSKKYHGNFLIGLEINSHPRWTEFVVGLLFTNLIIAFYKEAP